MKVTDLGFRVGDRVRIVGPSYDGRAGRVHKLLEGGGAVVHLDQGTLYAAQPEWIEPLTEFESTALTDDELDTLEAAKEANPWYFAALMEEAGIMPARREDYSPNADPHENFRVAADILKNYWKFTEAGVEIDGEDVAAMYIALKMARFLTGGDSDYQGSADSARDGSNYFKLWRAQRLQREQANDS